jgi:ATP-dependent exoDNAse (exonuclease V) beta subunit
LQKNDAYRNILAITFTNKAVHEMKSRIVGSLSEFAKDDPAQKAGMWDLAKDTALSIIKSKLNHNKSSSILFTYAFDISTIDKLLIK